MNRQQRRRLSKQERKAREKQTINSEDLRRIRDKSAEMIKREVYNNLVIIPVLYLMDKHGYKSNGVMNYMEWYNKTLEWADTTPGAYEEIRKELWERAQVRVEY